MGGVELVRCPLLLGIPGVAHVFSTRHVDGTADFDLGDAADGTPGTLERRRRLCRAAGLGDGPPVVLKQVHGRRIVSAAHGSSDGAVEADGVLAPRRGAPPPVLSVRSADCLPLLLADEDGRFVAAVHAGWRGTARGIARRAVALLVGQGIPAGRLRAALGPVAGPCCYEVGSEVLDAVAGACGAPARELQAVSGRGGITLDLAHANRLQLLAAGLCRASISSAAECTVCSGRYFSYRRDGSAAGRQMALIGWKAEPGGDGGRGATP